MKLLAAWAAVAAALCALQGPVTVEAKVLDLYNADMRAAQDSASLLRNKACNRKMSLYQMSDSERESASKYLNSNSNWIRDALRNSKTSKEFTDEVMKRTVGNIGGLVFQYSIFVVAILLPIFWCGCCWGWCIQCCKCCRRYRGPASKLYKGIMGGVISLLLLLALIFLVLMFGGAGMVATGSNKLMCQVGQLSRDFLDGTVEGVKYPNNGMVKMMLGFEEIADGLEPNGQFLNKIKQVMDATSPIEKNMNLLTGHMEMMNSALVSGKDLKSDFSCPVCAESGDAMTKGVDALKKGGPGALQDARKKIAKFTSPTEVKKLQDQMASAAKPLQNIAKQLKSMTKGMYNAEEQVAANMARFSMSVALLFSFAFLFILLTSLLSLCYFLFREIGPEGQNNPCPARWASASWCCSFFLLPLFCIFAGLLGVIGWFSGMFCASVDNLTSADLKAYGKAFGMKEKAADATTDPWDVVDTCMTATGDGKLLSVLKVKGDVCKDNTTTCADADKVKGVISAKKQFTGALKDPINKAFQDAEAKLAKLPDIADNADLKKFREYAALPWADMMIPNAAKLAANNELLMLGVHPSTQTLAATVTNQCGAPKNGFKLPDGTVSKVTLLSEADVRKQFSMAAQTTCFEPAGCPAVTDVAAAVASVEKTCKPAYEAKGAWSAAAATDLQSMKTGSAAIKAAAAERLMNGVGNTYKVVCGECGVVTRLFAAKQAFRNDKGFRCGGDLKASDLKQVDVNGVLEWKLVPTYVPCDFDTWAAHMSSFKAKIDSSITSTSDATKKFKTQVIVNLNAVIKQYIFDKVDSILDGMNCRFMYEGYKGIIEGLCYHAAVGCLVFSAMAKVFVGVCIVLMIVMYVLWRRVKDNITEAGASECTAE